MAIARHGRGVRADVGALASQVHPVFMLPPLAASAFGAVLADGFDAALLALHLTAVFAALYTAHIKDGYVDFYRRGEDDDHPLSAGGCRIALAGASAVFFGCLLAIGLLVDAWAALLTLPGWVIGYLHAPQLDLHPVGATAGYPAGIAFALLGGYYAQVGALGVQPVAFAAVLLVLLTGVKVVDDSKDYDYDRSIGKRTVAVVLGKQAARRFAYGLMAAAMAGVLAFAALAVFPPSAALAVGAFAAVAGFAARSDPTTATMLLVRGCYVFLAVLVAAVWFRPLA